MHRKSWIWNVFALTIFLLATACKIGGKEEVLIQYPFDSLEGVITQSGVALDRDITSDGRFSLRATVTEPSVVRLFETGDVDIEDAVLVYQAMLRTENIVGRVYLEMWCHFEGKGEFFSRGLDSFLSGTNEWNSQEIVFFLKKGENPDNVKLNIVCEGTGTFWVDNIRLLKRLS